MFRLPLASCLSLVLVSTAALGCRQEQDSGNIGHKKPETVRQEQQAARDWPGWADSRLGVGTGGLVAAEGSLHGNDWGVADSFEWELTFRDDAPPDRGALLRAAHRACAFPAAQALTSRRVTAHLVVPGARAVVPTLFTTDCDSGFDRLAPWLDHLERRPLPREVRGTDVYVQYDELDEADVLTLYVSSSDATAAVSARVARHHCGVPGPSRPSMRIRSSDQPGDVADSGRASTPVPTPGCASRR